ncbi:MAG: hypothetical protein AAB441_02915 [Patescibacteria group bacterium]
MQEKTSHKTVLAVIIFILFMWWVILNVRDKRNIEDIQQAVENVCNDYTLNTNCTKLGLEVIDEYKGLQESQDASLDN